MIRFKPGDRVCEIAHEERDAGKSWVITEIVGLGTLAVCYFLHPKRGERRLIPTHNLMHHPWPARPGPTPVT